MLTKYKINDNIEIENNQYKILDINNNIATIISLKDYNNYSIFDDYNSNYFNSSIDKILNNSIINKEIIVPTNINQDIYDDNLNYIKTIPIGQRYIYLLSIKDILKYSNNINFDSPYMQLRDGYLEEDNFIFNGLTNKIEPCAHDDLCAIRPALRIDLTKLK